MARAVRSHSRCEDDFRPRNQELESFASHLFHQDRDLHFPAGAQGEIPGGFGLGEPRETFVRISRTSRSLIWRAVRNLPSRPASGNR